MNLSNFRISERIKKVEMETENKLSSIYNQYLIGLDEKHVAARYKDNSWFHSSVAGLCARKHYFSTRVDASERKPVDENTRRLFRLGNLVHEDVQKAVTDHAVQYGLPLLIEKEIYLEDLNVRGFIDLALLDAEGDDHVLYDIKTCNSFKWKKMFGRYPDPNPSTNYFMQLATYGLWAKRFYELENISMKICYYNKDNSKMKEVDIGEEFIDEAMIYWMTVNELVKDDNMPDVSLGISPVYKWECNEKYCQFYEPCGGGLNG